MSTQKSSIPVFVKRHPNEWEYRGDFICNRYSQDREEINIVGQKISKRENIIGIIYMNQVF